MTAVLIIALLGAEPSAPPLVPLDDALDAAEVPSVPPPIDAPPPVSRGQRIAGTLVGAVLGDGVTFGIWVAELLTVDALCRSCTRNTVVFWGMGTLTAVAIGPFGALAGNRIAGGRAPYWKVLAGTAAGLAVS